MIKVKLDKETIEFIKSKAYLIKEEKIGVYFLKYNDAIVYVGKSINIKKRILNHLSQKIKIFNDFSFIECSEANIDSVELSYIIKHDPLFNKKDSLSDGESLEEFCNKNNISDMLYEKVNSKKTITISIDEDVLISADKMVYGKVEAQSRSHLIEMLILKEYAKFKKGK